MLKKILLVMFLALSSIVSASVDEASKAYDQKDYETAFRLYKEEAEKGSAEAQKYLGNMYSAGQGVALDYEQAVYWYRKAADQDYPKAQYNLGIMYSNGQGVAQDYKQAVVWWQKAADQGYASAQYNLGIMYSYGEGVTQDHKQAANWLIKSIRWPEKNETVGFKDYFIGDLFDLNNEPFFVTIDDFLRAGHSVPYENSYFNCVLKTPFPMVECEIDRGISENEDSLQWKLKNTNISNEEKERFKKVYNLRTAFSEKVTVKINLLLQESIDKLEWRARGGLNTGLANIYSIAITNEHPSPGFLEKAKNYFSEKLNSKPIVESTFNNPIQVYSKECIALLNRIKSKPMLELSINDKNEQERCNAAATLVMLSGKSMLRRETSYKWNISGKEQVRIDTSEKTITSSDGLLEININNVGILIEIDDKKGVFSALQNDILKMKKESEERVESKSKSDF